MPSTPDDTPAPKVCAQGAVPQSADDVPTERILPPYNERPHANVAISERKRVADITHADITRID